MAIQRLHQGPGFVVRHDQPLLGVPLQEEGQEVVCYFAEEGKRTPPSRRVPHRKPSVWQAPGMTSTGT